MLVVAIDDPARALELVKFARQARPDLHIVVRAYDRVAVYALFQAGANDIIREMFDSSVRAGRCALEGLGLHPYRAQKLVESHVQFDRVSMRMLAEVWDPELSIFENVDYIRVAAQRNSELEKVMRSGLRERPDRAERAWTPPPPPDVSGAEGGGRAPAASARGRDGRRDRRRGQRVSRLSAAKGSVRDVERARRQIRR